MHGDIVGGKKNSENKGGGKNIGGHNPLEPCLKEDFMQALASTRFFVLSGMALSAAFFVPARADFINLPVKYSQPIGLDGNGLIIGSDFSSDQTLNTVKADDFTDNYNDPVLAVRWWGSYGNTAQQADGFVGPFDISFHLADNTPHPFSLPVNAPLALYVVNAQQAFVGMDESGEPVYRYDAYLPTAFPEIAGTEYFMAIESPHRFRCGAGTKRLDRIRFWITPPSV